MTVKPPSTNIKSYPLIDSIIRLFVFVKNYLFSKKKTLTTHYSKTTQNRTKLIFVCWLALVIISLFTIFSASSMKGLNNYNDEYFFVRKQFVVAIFCWFFLIHSYLIPARVFYHMSLVAYLFVLFLLGLILVPGVYVHISGASRWMSLFGIRFQPAELAKLAMVMILARNLSRSKFDSHNFLLGVLPSMAFFILYAVFLMIQPDFGTSVLLAGVSFFMLAVAGIKKSVMTGFVSGGFCLLLAMIAIAPYRINRILAYLDPWKHADSSGFQIIQSYLGFQNGSVLGIGFGGSKQKLFFLPEAHTDFILSVIGEELGFVGVLFVQMCFFGLVYSGFRIARSQKDMFWYYICLGITLTISFQVIFNMGVVLGMLPTKGIPLPLVSGGASSLLVFSIMVGVLIRANLNNPIKNK